MDEQKGKMMKRHVSLAVATLAALALSAQTLEGSKTMDNWYVGVNGGVNVKTTQSAFTKDTNPSAGLRIGRALTPVLGVAVEGEVYFDKRAVNTDHSVRSSRGSMYRSWEQQTSATGCGGIRGLLAVSR